MTKKNDSEVGKFISYYNEVNHFGKDNGMLLQYHAPGSIEYRMRILDRHLSSPNTAHGGIIAGLMDSLIGAAALSLAFSENNLVSTVEFKINYFHPVHLGDELLGTSQIEFRGKTLIVASGEIHCPRRNLLVSKGLGTFSSYPVSKRNLGETFPM